MLIVRAWRECGELRALVSWSSDVGEDMPARASATTIEGVVSLVVGWLECV
jgi:hypothetical protein